MFRSANANDRGTSLIEIIVVMGIFGIIAAAMATLFSNQQHQMRILTQKQELLDLKNILLMQLSRPEICTWQFKDKRVDLSGSPTASNPSPSKVELNQLYHGPDTTSALIGETGQLLPGTQTRIRVSKISLEGFYTSGNPNEYIASLKVVLEEDSLAIPFQPSRITQVISVNPTDPIANKRIVSCGGSAQTQKRIFTNWPNNLICGNKVWTVYTPGQYHCFAGGETTTRSGLMTFSNSGVLQNCDDAGGGCGCAAPCDVSGQTIDGLILSGNAKD